MKVPLTYGFIMAIGGSLLLLLMYFMGLHDSVEKMQSSQWVGTIAGVTITVGCLALAMREKRSLSTDAGTWGYGSAFGTGILTGLVGAVIGAAFAYVYFAYINPNMSEVTLQMGTARMEAKGMSASQIASAEPMMRKMMTPLVLTLLQGFFGFLWSVFLALIVAIFFRKARDTAATEIPPPV